METLGSKFDEILSQQEVLDKTCEKHPDIKLIRIKNHVFCTECVKENQQADIQAKGRKIIQRRTTDTLKKDSIFDDPDLKEANFDNYQTVSDEVASNKNQAIQIAKGYLDKKNKGNTVLSGSPGTGKSHLAYSILKYVNEYSTEPQSCLFIDFDELLRRIKNSFNDSNSIYQESTMIDLLGSTDLLVIDDLGSESTFKNVGEESSNFNQKILFAILNKRSRTIITTNLTGKQLKDTYNSKIVSRIMKRTNGKVIKFSESKDYRTSGLENF